MILVILPSTFKEPQYCLALEFCRDYMSRQWKKENIRFPDNMPDVSWVLSACAQEGSFLFVSPMAIMTYHSMKALDTVSKAEGWDVAGPVTGGTYNRQAPQLPFEYLDLSTFEEVSGIITQSYSQNPFPVKTLSSEVLWCKKSFLSSLPKFLSVSELVNHDRFRKARKMVVPQCLAHTFQDYHGHQRADLADLIPMSVRSLIDVGCGEGGLGYLLKIRKPDLQLFGIEPNRQAAQKAMKIYNHVYHGNAESFSEDKHFDGIVCADVLEHMYDPWQTLSRLGKTINPGGWLIGSCPNAAHWTVVRGLLKGEFNYIPAGILCFDHIRFFTRNTLEKLITGSGFEGLEIWPKKPPPTPEGIKFLSRISSTGYEKNDLLTATYHFRAIKS